MKKHTLVGMLLLFFNYSELGYSWNAVGHRLVAQIAYNHLTPEAKYKFNAYNHALDNVYKPLSFVDAATWLDTLRYQDVNWFSTMHYIDVAFSNDKSSLPKPAKINAIWAIRNALKLIKNRYSTAFDKGIATRILLHVVGDIHQPLHAATQVSKRMQSGDHGGNKYLLKNNTIAKNLHAYWDKGGGAFSQKKHYSANQIREISNQIEHQWPCNLEKMDLNPIEWAKESHHLAISVAYNLPIDSKYQVIANNVSKQRIAIAGCRLARLLNTSV